MLFVSGGLMVRTSVSSGSVISRSNPVCIGPLRIELNEGLTMSGGEIVTSEPGEHHRELMALGDGNAWHTDRQLEDPSDLRQVAKAAIAALQVVERSDGHDPAIDGLEEAR